MTQRVLVTGRGFRHRKRNSADIRGKRRHSLRVRCGTETATLPFCLAMQFLQRRVGAERPRLLRLLPAGLAGWPVTYWECAALSPRRLARRIVSVTAPGETMTSVHGAAPSAMGRNQSFAARRLSVQFDQTRLSAEGVLLTQQGIHFTPVGLGVSLGGWRTPEILSLGLITPGRSRKLTSGFVAMRPVATISGACAGPTGSSARVANGPANRG